MYLVDKVADIMVDKVADIMEDKAWDVSWWFKYNTKFGLSIKGGLNIKYKVRDGCSSDCSGLAMAWNLTSNDNTTSHALALH